MKKFKLFLMLGLLLTSIGVKAASEIYAKLDGTKMTIYYGTKPSTAMTNWTPTAGAYNMTTEERAAITSVAIDASMKNAKPTTLLRWFLGFSNATSITGLANLNTEDVTNISATFSGCQKLSNLDLRNFNTAKVTIFSACFYNCKNLITLYIDTWDTSNATTIDNMFYGCANLPALSLGGFNTSKVLKMNSTFYGCESLKELDLTSFSFANVDSTKSMFYNCKNLTTIYCTYDLSASTKLKKSTSMFGNCNKLVGEKGTKKTSEHIDASYARLDGGTSKPGYFSHKKEIYTVWDNDRTLTYMFDGARSSRVGVTEVYDQGYPIAVRFDGYNDKVKKIVIDESMKDAPLSTMRYFFYGGATDHALSALTEITGLENLNTADVIDMSGTFAYCSALTSLDLSTFNTAKVLTMYQMFRKCEQLQSLNLSSFNTDKVTDMGYMFLDCEALEEINIESFTFTSLKSTNWTFGSCAKLKTIYCEADLSAMDQLTASADMFNYSTKLVGGKGTKYNASYTNKSYARPDEGTSKPGYFTVPKKLAIYAAVSDEGKTFTLYYDKEQTTREGVVTDWNAEDGAQNWDVDERIKVTKVVFDESMEDARPTVLSHWFQLFKSLAEFENLEYLNTSEVKWMNYTFFHNDALTSLDLTTFDFSKVTKTSSMFAYSENLKAIYCKADLTGISDAYNMFYNCKALKGYKGTAYTSSHYDNAYARLDEGESKPGYFSDKTSKELYGVLSDAGKTLTIRFDDQKPWAENVSNWPATFAQDFTAITKVVFDASVVAARPADMSSWFAGCEALATIEGIENLNTSEVTKMERAFHNCKALTSIDLNYFDITKLEDTYQMFIGCENLETIYCDNDWTKGGITESAAMFRNCTKLVGGNGTPYDDSKVDISYARPDRGDTYPGYFTHALSCPLPTNVEVSNISTTSAVVTWTAGGGVGEIWDVILQKKGDMTRYWVAIMLTERTFTLGATEEEALEPNTTYLVGVRANCSDESETSAITQMIEFSTSEPTAVDNVSALTPANKRIENGQLLIEHNGKVYNAQGAEVK